MTAIEDVLDYLESDLASEFVCRVEAALRRLTDVEVNQLYLMTHTDDYFGANPGTRITVLMPLIEKEWDLRRDLEIVPDIGPPVAPDLYSVGGGHYRQVRRHQAATRTMSPVDDRDLPF